jgi:antitoxin Phd
VNKGVIFLTVDTNVLVPMTEANQNFSKVVRIVEENGMAVILKNNVPRYMVLSFKEYDEIKSARQRLFNEAADSIISENLDALKELAK